MTCLVHRRSAGFLLAAWFLMAALFADGVNLDDLVPGTFVIHDSDDTVQSVFFTVSQERHSSQNDSFHAKQVARASAKASGRSFRIVFDEDSPSEAADPLGSDFVAIAPVCDDQPVTVTGGTSTGLLHLLHCTLLI